MNNYEEIDRLSELLGDSRKYSPPKPPKPGDVITCKNPNSSIETRTKGSQRYFCIFFEDGKWFAVPSGGHTLGTLRVLLPQGATGGYMKARITGSTPSYLTGEFFGEVKFNAHGRAQGR